jgi:hypothetical protein
MDATLYTGNGSTQTVNNTDQGTVGFKPDFVWIKIRGNVADHRLTDSVRGVTKEIYSNTTAAEATDANGLTAFNINGFTVGSTGAYNLNGGSLVGWNWQAGQGTNTSNTSGSITSTVSVNATAGFSIVTFTVPGSGTSDTIGHGLSSAPQLIITKSRQYAYNWATYHVSLGNAQRVLLNTTDAAASTSAWNSTTPTSSVFSVGSSIYGNGNMVAYCWTPIAGYSQFGSYTGNGSADGPFVYLGFRPRFILWKCTTTGATDWDIYDSVRDPYNAANHRLIPDSSGAEQTLSPPTFDILSNGFKLRYGYSSSNNNGDNYIYAAFAENPFKYANAR